MDFRISDVQNFVATASCRTITEAAQKLEVSQPALSESLKRLEFDLGATMFYRSRSGIQLTPSGKVFLGKANKLLQACGELTIEEDRSRVFNERVVSIGSHPVVAQYFLPAALAELRKRAPDYKVELHHDLSRTIQMQVQRGLIDVGLVINPVFVPDLVVQKLGVDDVHVWESDPKAKLDTAFCNVKLFQTQSILKKWKSAPKRVVSTDSLELICRFVAEGVGYGIIPERAVILSDLRLKKLAGTPSYRDEIALVHRPEYGKLLPERLVLEALKKAVLADKK